MPKQKIAFSEISSESRLAALSSLGVFLLQLVVFSIAVIANPHAHVIPQLRESKCVCRAVSAKDVTETKC